MKAVTTFELQQHIEEYLTEAQSEQIAVVTENGTVLLLSVVTADDLADEALENDPRFIQIMEKRRAMYRIKGGRPLLAVREEIEKD